MQKVSILCVGKLKEKFYRDAVEEYSKRLQRFCKLEITELPETRLPEDPSPRARCGRRWPRRPRSSASGSRAAARSSPSAWRESPARARS